jgi:hypothetical protein
MGKRNNLGRRRNIWSHQVLREKERLEKKKKKKKTESENPVQSTTTVVNKKNNKRKLDEQQSTDSKDSDVTMTNATQPMIKKRRKVKRNKAYYKKIQAEKCRQKNYKLEAAKEAAKLAMSVEA